LKDIVKRHQGIVTDNELEATHLIHQAADPLDEEYARPVFRRDKTVLMHW
jgi:SWI/SNF related-matrix-associated actin-dependent regulator of chromatin subfamily C